MDRRHTVAFGAIPLRASLNELFVTLLCEP